MFGPNSPFATIRVYLFFHVYMRTFCQHYLENFVSLKPQNLHKITYNTGNFRIQLHTHHDFVSLLEYEQVCMRILFQNNSEKFENLETSIQNNV